MEKKLTRVEKENKRLKDLQAFSQTQYKELRKYTDVEIKQKNEELASIKEYPLL